MQSLYNDLSYLYPRSDIWIIGHSLGGALASLLGVTFGVPVVTFESPGERMASGRLHLPSPVLPFHLSRFYSRTYQYLRSLLPTTSLTSTTPGIQYQWERVTAFFLRATLLVLPWNLVVIWERRLCTTPCLTYHGVLISEHTPSPP